MRNLKHEISRSRTSVRERGFTILLAALVASLVLALGISVFSIAQKQVILSSIGRSSQVAFYAADTAAECGLYWDLRHNAFGPPEESGGGEVGGTQSYSSNGTFTVPAGISEVAVKMWGAGGQSASASGGGGGYTSATISVTPGEQLTVLVGTASGSNGGGSGAFNGGSGGGRSAIRRGSTELITAGGGGGGGSGTFGAQNGGAGGGATGQTGHGGGGTQSGGGATNCGGAVQFQGGPACPSNGFQPTGGGGGGWYGGGGGTAGQQNGGGGGGGSGYCGGDGVTSCTTTTGSGATPGNSGDPVRPSGAGDPNGNGAVIVEYSETGEVGSGDAFTTAQCDGQDLGTLQFLGYGAANAQEFEYEPGGFCARVTVTKDTAHPRTRIHADGFSTTCAETGTSNRALQRSVELTY